MFSLAGRASLAPEIGRCSEGRHISSGASRPTGSTLVFARVASESRLARKGRLQTRIPAGRARNSLGAHDGRGSPLFAARPNAAQGSLRSRRGHFRAASSKTQTASDELRIELPSVEARDDIRLGAAVEKRAKRIVVESVVPGSTAEQLGVRIGSKLKALSDPVRANEIWELNDRASLRFVRDAIRMRVSPTITLVFSGAVAVPNQAPAPPAPAAEEEGSKASGTGSVSAPGGAELQGGTAGGAATSSAGQTMGSIDMLTSRDDGDDDEQQPGAPLPGLAGEGIDSSGAVTRQQQQVSAAETRMKARKDYLEEVGGRDDSKFFAMVALAFLAPAAIILIAAFASGYMDELQMSTLSR